MWTFAAEAVPDEMLEAARIDGAGEFRTFFRSPLPLLGPGIVTVLLFNMVATWNNYFLPLIMLKQTRTGTRSPSASTLERPGGRRRAARPSSTSSSPDRCSPSCRCSRRLPAAAALLAVRPERRQRQE
jgi:hypothetical protein